MSPIRILSLFALLAVLPALALGLVARPTHAQAGAPMGMPYSWAETGQRFAKLQDAVKAIGPGRGTIRIAPGRIVDCAVQVEGEISYVAEVPGQTTFEVNQCEGKAALVLRGVGAHVSGLIFNHFTNSDGNAACIRLEKGNLTVTGSWFHDSENGILGDSDANASVVIDRSTFTHLGRCDRGLSCAHSVYIGFYDSVTVTNSRFEMGNGGHYLKARATHVTVRDNSFDDSQGHLTNYMIDLPAGANGRVEGNWIIQGANKENPSALITVAAESHNHSADGLVIANNVARLAPGVTTGTALVADWSGDHLAIANNRLGDNIASFQHRMSHDEVDRLKSMTGMKDLSALKQVAGAIPLGH